MCWDTSHPLRFDAPYRLQIPSELKSWLLVLTYQALLESIANHAGGATASSALWVSCSSSLRLGRRGCPTFCSLPPSLFQLSGVPGACPPRTYMSPSEYQSISLPQPTSRRLSAFLYTILLFHLVCKCVCVYITFKTDFMFWISFRFTQKLRHYDRVPTYLTPNFSYYPPLT